jgi:hypothetical protein
MGIHTSFGALLVRAKERGASFQSMATIGRQSLSVPLNDLAIWAGRLGVSEPDWGTFAADGYSEDFFARILGAETVTSFDFSGYQRATVVHDFNEPLPRACHAVHDAVVDGGTIEHIFDVKQVLSNYMALPKIGGDVYICTAANNLCGHGFYQFSPEFFYRVFSEANGYHIESVCLIETPFHLVEKSPRQRVFAAVDPAVAGKRTVIVTDKPVSIFVHARRIADRPLFSQAPYQSDYLDEWNAHTAEEARKNDGEPRSHADSGTVAEGSRRFTYLSRGQALRRWLLQRRKNSLRNRKWFKPLTP